ncbi:winged helix-turn-helix transcriptional regulator [Catenuloplanes japonicus]|uniref:winged helix-turn-helix transcriptional regulator n=1 Tax=Catenuloplanes japonicus TaxID=33876 RepID=UPI0005255E5D|nr:helix-turn-helix domain-containing protein [Catenuloplanes japonicus]
MTAGGPCTAPLIADKWSLPVIGRLADGPRRFTELKRALPGISQRVLTATLRTLERDGFVNRTVYAVMPPNVTYRLTPLGESILGAAAPMRAWKNTHLPEVERARLDYDARATPDN